MGEDAIRRNEADVPLLPLPGQWTAGAQDVPAPRLAAVVHRAGSAATLPQVPGLKKMGRNMALPMAQGSEKLPLGVQSSESARIRVLGVQPSTIVRASAHGKKGVLPHTQMTTESASAHSLKGPEVQRQESVCRALTEQSLS